jgi:hypothetical protein
MRDLRWGMPSSKTALLDAATRRADKLRARGEAFDFNALLRMEPDKGATNIRNTASQHWQPWLDPKHRCLAPFTSFSEPDQVGGSLKPVRFALHEARPLAFFAGVWTPWGCVRKIKSGWEDCELFGFLTTTPTRPVVEVREDRHRLDLHLPWRMGHGDPRAPLSARAAYPPPSHSRPGQRASPQVAFGPWVPIKAGRLTRSFVAERSQVASSSPRGTGISAGVSAASGPGGGTGRRAAGRPFQGSAT